MMKKRYAVIIIVAAGCVGFLIGFSALRIAGLLYARHPSPYYVLENERVEWNKELQKVGLAPIPQGVRYGSHEIMNFGGVGDWSFRADDGVVRKWLSDSKTIQTAEIRKKPGKEAYLFSVPFADKVKGCVIIVNEYGEEADVLISIIALGPVRNESGNLKYTDEEIEKILQETIENSYQWLYR